MDIKFRGDKGLLQPSQVKRSQNSTEEAANKQGHGNDKVSFSSILKQASKSGTVAAPATTTGLEGLRSPMVETISTIDHVENGDDIQRAAKVAELKQQIADGSYQPDLKKVAGSMLQFLAQERDV